ncbi:MAG TPA: hypothetical protein PK470_02090 [Candidatus Omnitrophota bacterium]|nr:hypothetical protein [Candidatus Omnitrophota bacterium]
MEILLILAGLVLLLFALGVVLVIKGGPVSSSHDVAASGEEIVRVQKELGTSREEEGRLKQQLDALAVELHEAQSHIQDAQKMEGLLDTLSRQEADSQKMVQHLERSLAFLRQKADEQARAAKDVIEALLMKNETLSRDVTDAKSRFDEKEFVSVKEDNQRLHEDLKALLVKVENFELRIAQKEKEMSAREHETSLESQRYRQNMVRLKQGLLQIIQGVRAAGQEMAGVKQAYDLRSKQLLKDKENQLLLRQQDILNREQQLGRFQDQIKEKTEALLELEQALAVSRDKIAASDQLIRKLQEQLQTQATKAVSSPGNFAAEHSLREERDRFLQDKHALEIKITELREAHEFLQQKEKILQRELTKSRTEAMGFRKICEGYKTQIEQGSR